MTEEQPITEALPVEEPAPESAADSEVVEAAASPANARAREWLSQLESMIQNVAREAAPVAREVGAKAAELAAVAAVKAGPIAQKAAEATTEYGQKFAEKAQSVAAEWRHENEAEPADGAAAEGEASPETGEDPAASI